MVPRDVGTERPSKLRKSVVHVHGKFPTSSFTVQHKTFMKNGPFDLTTKMGKVVGKFCDDYDVLNAEVHQGVVDPEKITEQMKESLANLQISGRVKRDVVFREPMKFLECEKDQVLNSLNQCFGDYRNLKVKCKFGSLSCVYIVNCDFGNVDRGLQTTCKGKHELDQAMCCEYTC